MKDLRITLLSDGSSDRVLLRHIEWLLEQHVRRDFAIQPYWADLRSITPRPKELSDRIGTAIELYPCDVLFVHRDAEGDSKKAEERFGEIKSAAAPFDASAPPIVPVVPIRMQEAWLLFDVDAIRRAAGNPTGGKPLDIPSLSETERRADPKKLLHEILRIASDTSGRKRRNFRVRRAVHRVGDLIKDFSPLRQLTAFKRLEDDLKHVLVDNDWL